MLKQYNVKTLIKTGDISDSKFVESMISEIISELGLLHIVINNTGISGEPHSILKISEEEAQKIININFKGT